MHKKFLLENWKGRGHLGDLAADGRITIITSKKEHENVNLNHLGQSWGSIQHCNEWSHSIKGGQFDLLNDCKVIKKHSSM